MTGRDDETPRIGAHGLVLGLAKRNEPVAAELAALAPEHDNSIRALGFDRFVEPAKSRLTARDAPHGPGVHLTGGSVRTELHLSCTNCALHSDHATNECWFVTKRRQRVGAVNGPVRLGLAAVFTHEGEPH